MRHIQGKSVKDQLLSVDGILEGLLTKQVMIQENLNKRNETLMPFSISGYIDKCVSGDIVCAYLSLAKVKLKRAVVVVDELSKESDVYLNIHILSDDGNKSTNKVSIKKGINTFLEEREVKIGDRISMTIDYSHTEPQGIWVAMRGDRA